MQSLFNILPVDRVTVYLKDGKRIEFTDMPGLRITAEETQGLRLDYTLELSTPVCTLHQKRTSKRYTKNRRGWRK